MKIQVEMTQQEAYLLGLALQAFASLREEDKSCDPPGYDQTTKVIKGWGDKLEKLGLVEEDSDPDVRLWSHLTW